MMRLSRAERWLWFGIPVLSMLVLCGCYRSPEAKAAKFLERGKQYRAAKDLNRADLEFKNAIAVMPKNAEAYYQLGLVYLDKGATGPAAQLFAKATQLNPKHREAEVKLSELMAATRDKDMVERAEVQAQNLVAADPKDLEALNLLAMTELKLGKPEDAGRHLQEALKIMPGDVKAAANLATLKLVQRDFAGAEKALKDAVTALPKSPKPHIALGRLYLMLNKPADARQQFHLALQLDPASEAALRDIADLARSQGDFKEAAQSLQKLSRMPPAENRFLYGTFLLQEGKAAEAATEFERLLKQDVNDRQAWIRLMNAYLVLGRRADADRMVADALKRNPNHEEALLQRAQSHLRAGKLNEAQLDIQKVLAVSKNSAGAHYLMGTVRRMGGDDLTARQEFAEAVNANPGLLPARLELARIQISQNNAKVALEVLQAAPAFQHADPKLIIQRNWALMGAGEWPELRKSLDQALARYKNPEFQLQDGIWKVQHKDYVAGEKSLAEALAAASEDIRPLKVIAGIYMAQKQPAMALQKVTEYANLYPRSVAVQQFLGNWLMANGRANQAKSVFLGIKAGHPDDAQADLSIAEAELAGGHKDEAKKLLASLLSSPQVAAKAGLMLGTLEESDSRPASAIECYRAVLRLEPRNVIALNNLASLLGNTPDGLDSASEYAKQAKNLAPESGVVQDTLGWILFQQGQYAQSVQELEGAASKMASALPKYHLAMAYAKSRQQERARRMLDAALKLDPKLPEAKTAALMISAANN